MAKDIMELTSEEELREYLEETHVQVTEALQTARHNMNEIEEAYDNSVFSVNSVEDLEGLDIHTIFYYIQAIQALAISIDTNAFHKLGNTIRRVETGLSDIPTMWDAIQIKKHWQKLNKHFDENPTLREEWDALCMGIRLTEDE